MQIAKIAQAVSVLPRCVCHLAGVGLMLAFCTALTYSQDTGVKADHKLTVTAYRDTYLRGGPGDTYAEAALLPAGVEVEVLERNRTGTWLYVRRQNAQGDIILDGWMLSGYLNDLTDLRYSQIPVNDALKDADPSTVNSRSMAQLYAAPVISEISEAMHDVFATGLAKGNRPNVVTKVGDSLSASELYLTLFSRDDVELGPYDYLEDTLAFFGVSTEDESVAARIGLTTYVVFDPLWADKERCKANESPLACEYRLKKPSIALIMFGANDVRHMTDAEFAEQMRQIVEYSLDNGVIPVLSTFSYSPDDALWWQSVNFNIRLTEVAAEYEVPLINLWSAARILPDYGLDVDEVHLANSGFPYLTFATGHEAYYGNSLRNLLTLCMLDELRSTLKMDSVANESTKDDK